MKKISGFNAPIQNITKTFLIDLPELFETIRNDEEIKQIVQRVRTNENKKERDEIKKNKLFAITFSGQFSKRGKDYLERHSGLICIDIDKLDIKGLIKTKNTLDRLQSLLVGYFNSPSGDGYKVIIRVDYKKFNH